MPSLSIAICTKDRPEFLRRCLASCEAVRDDVLEIVVVDNGSATDEPRRIAEAARVRYVREDTPGLSAARNRAIAEARGELIAYIDDDCEVTPGWATAIAGRFGESVGCVTGRIAVPPDADSLQRTIGRHSGGARGDSTYRVQPGDADRVFARAIAGIGANMAFRRDLLQKIGGFPEVFRSAGDDFYIFFSVLRAGFELAYEPAAVVNQHHRETRLAHARRTFYYGRQTVLVFAYCAARVGGGLAFNITREVAVRLYVIARSLLTGAFSRALFNATALAGIAAGAVTVPFRLGRVEKDVARLAQSER